MLVIFVTKLSPVIPLKLVKSLLLNMDINMDMYLFIWSLHQDTKERTFHPSQKEKIIIFILVRSTGDL